MIKLTRNIFFFSLFSLIIPFTGITGAAAQGVGVKELFQDLSEEQLLEQVAQGEELMKYMETQATPQEREEFEKAMMEMMNSFSEDDWREIQAIGEAVEGKLPEPKPVKAKAKQDSKSTKKKGKPVKADESIKALLVSINKTIDLILIKVESDRYLAEYFSSHASKASIALFQRFISLLKTKQNIKRLSDKKNKENQKLIKELKEFKAKIEKLEKSFHVDDSFGLDPDIDKTLKDKKKKSVTPKKNKSHKENVRKLNAIIKEFNHGLEDVLPEMEKFIRQYADEAQELAKLYEQLRSSSAKHAKSSQVKRGSKPVKPAPQRQTPRQTQSSQPAANSGGYYGNPYDYYDDYYGNPYGQEAKRKKKRNGKKDGKKKAAPKAQKPKAKEEDIAYEEIIEKLEEYINAFDRLENKKIIQLYARFLSQPSEFTHTTPAPANVPEEVAAAQKITDFCRREEQRLIQFQKDSEDVEALINFNNINEAMNEVQKKVSQLDLPQLQKLKSSSSYRNVLQQAEEFVEILDKFTTDFKVTEEDNRRELKAELTALGNLPADQKTEKKQEIEKLSKDYIGIIKAHEGIYSNMRSVTSIFKRSIKSAERRRRKHKKPTKREKSKSDDSASTP